MDADEDEKYRRYANIPIPTYEEALSRPSSSQHHHGAQEVSNDAERENLLYEQPTVESARSSLESDLGLPEVSGNGEDARRVMEELDYMEPDLSRRSPRLYHRARIRSKLSQRWSHFSATLSSIRLPRVPSFRSLYAAVPDDSAPSPLPTRSTWSRIVSIPDKYRMSASTFARLCGLFTIGMTIYVLFAVGVFTSNARNMYGAGRFDPESIRHFVADRVSNGMQSLMQDITAIDHVAGTKGDLYLAAQKIERWFAKEPSAFDRIELNSYYVYMNYPSEDRSVGIVSPADKVWTAALDEEPVQGAKGTLAYHGHSFSAEVEGHLIYANGGSRSDFETLKNKGIVLTGSIALVKVAGTESDPALKVKAAEQAGCAGVLIYSDPSDVDESKPWRRPEDSLQRDTVSMTSWVLGDPLTPGFASVLGADRVNKDNNLVLPGIPSLPLAWRDAKVLLSSLSNHGLRMDEWVHGDFPKEWWSGNISGGPDLNSPIVHLKNKNDENPLQEIWNVHGQFEGIETPEKKIIVGTHQDAWCVGAVESGTGSAVLMHLAEIFGELRKMGWRPLRTIEFVSWDGSQYGLMGSTEYVEDNLDDLRANTVAYINVDVGVSGVDFHSRGSPLCSDSLKHVLGKVNDPGGNGTVLDRWNTLGALGADADSAPFQHMAGTSSLDFGFRGNEFGYPKHSCYDTLDFLERPTDGFENHEEHSRAKWVGAQHALAQILAFAILEFADRPILPFDVRVYAVALKDYVQELERIAQSINGGQVPTTNQFDPKPLHDSVDLLSTNAHTFHQWENQWSAKVLGAGGFEPTAYGTKRIQYNERLAHFEKGLLDIPSGPMDKPDDTYGIPGREQFKHVVFGPRLWGGRSSSIPFPAVVDALDRDPPDWKTAQKALERAASRIQGAAERLLT